jgi:hypothetical protein
MSEHKTRGKNLTPAIKDEINRRHNEGESYLHIGTSLGLQKSTVSNVVLRTRATADLPPKPRVIHRSTDGPVGVAASKLIIDKPYLPYRKMVGNLKDELPQGTNVPSYVTIYRYLQRKGYTTKPLLRKPLISGVNKEKRV